MILLIDNYDSFTYNLFQYLGELGKEVMVFRNDEISVEQAERLSPTHLVISPGPGEPRSAGISMAMITHFAPTIPILGVCLGHQCIAECFGGTVTRAENLRHGKTSPIYHSGEGVFRGIPTPFEATRYHSLIVDDQSLPDTIRVTAHTSEGEIMGLRLKGRSVEGVQFHPESILTKHGKLLLSNFVSGR